MRKPIPLSEKRIMVSIKYGVVEALHNINDDISTAIELLLSEVNKKDAKIFERDSVIEKLANCIDGIDKAMKEDNDKEVSDNLAKAKEILRQHLEYLNAKK